MVPIPELWLPILVSAAVVTVAAVLLRRLLPDPAATSYRGTAAPLATGLALHFVYALVVSLLIAYLAGRTLEPGVDYKAVFRVAATAGILAYAFGGLYSAVWGTRTWVSGLRDFAHGVVLGLLAAGPFGWLWPEA